MGKHKVFSWGLLLIITGFLVVALRSQRKKLEKLWLTERSGNGYYQW